jgi:hypothetical protein
MNDRIDRARALEVVERAIAPFVGETLARASTRAHCERLGLTGTSVSPAALETVLEQVAKGMRVFVGSRQTAEVMDRIRADVARLGGDP